MKSINGPVRMMWKSTIEEDERQSLVAQPTGAEAGVDDPSRYRYEQNDCGKRAGAKASSCQERHDVEEKVDKNQTVKRKANKRVAAAQQCGYRRGNPDRRNVDGQEIRCRNWTVRRRGQFQDCADLSRKLRHTTKHVDAIFLYVVQQVDRQRKPG